MRPSAAAEVRPSLLGCCRRFPSTGFGYIEKGAARTDGGHAVARFIEKPERAKAEQMLLSREVSGTPASSSPSPACGVMSAVGTPWPTWAHPTTTATAWKAKASPSSRATRSCTRRIAAWWRWRRRLVDRGHARRRAGHAPRRGRTGQERRCGTREIEQPAGCAAPPSAPSLGQLRQHRIGPPLPGQAHRGQALGLAQSAEALPQRRALGGGQGHRRSDARQGHVSAHGEPVHLHSGGRGAPASQPQKDFSRNDRCLAA